MTLLDKEQLGWLRRLRFPPELEREFQEEYAAASVLYLRLVYGFLALINAVWAVRAGVMGEAGPGMMPARVGNALLFLGVIGLTYTPLFRRRMQWILAGASMAFTLMEAYALSFGLFENNQFPFFASVAFLCLIVISWYLLIRMQLLPALLTSIVFMAVLYPKFTSLLKPGPMQVQLGWAFLLLNNATGMVGGWFLERSARADYLLNRLLRQERDRADDLLRNILPAPIAEQLKVRPGTIADAYAEVTVLFADLVGFTPLSARMDPDETVGLLNTVFSEFDQLAERHGLEKIKTIGDAYMVVGGLPEPRADHAAAVARMALEMVERLRELNERLGVPLQMRVGMNSGPVVAGVIGRQKFIYDLWGDTVNVASRMESHGLEGAIHVTEATYDRLKEDFRLEPRERMQIRGRGEMQTYLLLGARMPSASGPGATGRQESWRPGGRHPGCLSASTSSPRGASLRSTPGSAK